MNVTVDAVFYTLVGILCFACGVYAHYTFGDEVKHPENPLAEHLTFDYWNVPCNIVTSWPYAERFILDPTDIVYCSDFGLDRFTYKGKTVGFITATDAAAYNNWYKEYTKITSQQPSELGNLRRTFDVAGCGGAGGGKTATLYYPISQVFYTNNEPEKVTVEKAVHYKGSVKTSDNLVRLPRDLVKPNDCYYIEDTETFVVYRGTDWASLEEVLGLPTEAPETPSDKVINFKGRVERLSDLMCSTKSFTIGDCYHVDTLTTCYVWDGYGWLTMLDYANK